MEVLNFSISDLKPYENNPRVIDDEAIEKVATSIREFGFKVPILIDKENTIIAGHTRLEASKKLGLTEVPCIKIEDLTDEQIRAFRLADNKVAEYSDWDFEKLELELAELKEIDTLSLGFADFDGIEESKNEDDMEEIDDEQNGSTTAVEYKLTCKDIKLILTEDEFELFHRKYEEYLNENGVSFGFILELCHD